MDMDDVSRVNGFGFVTQTDKARFGFSHSALWQPDVFQYADYWLKGFQDWGEYDGMVVTMYSNKATDKYIFIRYMSDTNYNTQKLKVNWQGWTSILIPFGTSNRDKVSYIRLGASSATDGIYGQEITVASMRLIKYDEYNLRDSAFGYEVSDTTEAVLGDGAAVYADCGYAIVNGERRLIGDNGETAINRDGTIMVPTEFIKSIGWKVKKNYESEYGMDGTDYVSFSEAAEYQGLRCAVSDGLAVAATDGVELFDGVNKQNPYAACATYMVCATPDTADVTADDYGKIRQYLRQELLDCGNTDTAEAKRQIAFAQRNADNPFTDLTFKSASDVAEAYARIESIALAYATPDTELTGDESAKTAILNALEYMYENHYGVRQLNGTGMPYNGDSDEVYTEVYIPNHIVNILLLLGDDISDENRSKYLSVCTQNGILYADCEDTAATSAWTLIGIGVLSESADFVRYGRDKITERLLYADDERSQNSEPLRVLQDEIHVPITERRIEDMSAYVRGNMTEYSGQGIMGDGTYISGGANGENLSSGLKLLDVMSVSAALADTPFALDSHIGEQLFEIIQNGYYPFVCNGTAMRMVSGNENDGLRENGLAVLGAMIDTIGVVPESCRDELYGMIKSLADEYSADEKSNLSERRRTALDEIGDTATAVERNENHMYARMDKALHTTDGFTAGISMSSNRIFDYNSTQCKNINGWYMNSGMTTVYIDGDDRNFSDEYWNDVNPYKLPGTTVSLAKRAAVSVRNGLEYKDGSPFVGGVTDGTVGVATMTVKPYKYRNTPGTGEVATAVSEGRLPDCDIELSAKKSWFMFGDEIVALGSGITGGDGERVITTVDNRYGDAVTVNGRYAHIKGDGECGYYFPTANRVSSQKTQDGLCELWVDHGINPNNAEYAYVILPAKSESETRAYAANPDIKILANNGTVQAVEYNSGEILGYVFHKPQTFDGVTVSEPMIVMRNKTENAIYVSDPTHTIKSAVIAVTGKYEPKSAQVQSYEYKDGVTVMNINFADSNGKTIAIKL